MWASFSVQALKIHAFVSGQPKRSKSRGRINECWGFKSFAFCTVHLACIYVFVILLIVRKSFCDFINSTVIVQTSFTDLNYCFTVHFDKYKIIFPTNALFIKT
jgi:hypothetical protein